MPSRFSRLRGVLSLPWLVSANLHAATVLLLMCTLAPLNSRAPRPIEVVFASHDELPPPVDVAMETLVDERPPSEIIHDVPSPVQVIDVPLPASFTDPSDYHPTRVGAAAAGAEVAVEDLLVKLARSLDETFGRQGPELTGEAFGSRGAGTGGSVDKASFFGTAAQGKRFVYVLDMSGSMKDGGDGTLAGCRFRRAVEELLRSIDGLAMDQLFYVYLFSDETRPLFDEPFAAPRWRQATAETKAMLAAWLAAVQPSGGTDPRAALSLGMALRPDALFLLSDGRFHGKEHQVVGPPPRRSKRAGEGAGEFAPQGGAPIHTFAFEDVLACNSLQALAFRTGGVYRFIPPIFRHGKHDKTPPIKDEVYAENLLKTAESLDRIGRTAEALEQYRELEQRFPDTPAAEEAARRTAALAEAATNL